MIPISAVIVIAALAAIFVLYRSRRRVAAAIIGVLALAPLSYFVVGLAVPRVTGEGRFFSFPFGGLRVGDAEMLLSLAAWTLLWAAAFGYLLLRRT